MKITPLLLLFCILVGELYALGISTPHRTFTSVEDMQPSDWHSPDELDRAWQQSVVRIPHEKSISQTSMRDIEAKHFPEIALPVIIYLHGCTGHIAGSIQRMEWLAKHGFIVIGPDSLARKKYPQSCDPYSFRGGLYRETLIMRQQDALYAVKQARSLDWVDADNIFIVGHSEGGITAATMTSDSDEHRVNARVIEGWTCHAVGWEEYSGIKAPKSEPVMTLVGEKDPWFQSEYTRGDCTSFIDKSNGSQSIVISEGHLAHKHDLLLDQELQIKVIAFLRKHMN
jgi:dienelactone hydrolase